MNQPSPTPPIRKLLVIRLGALGDLFHLSAAIGQLHAQHPTLEIHLLTAPAYKTLTCQFSGVHRVWVFTKGAHWLATWNHLNALAGQLKAEGIDGVVVLQPSLKFWLLQRLLLGWGKGLQRSATYHKQKLTVFGLSQRTLPRKHAVEDFYEPFCRLFQMPLKTAETLIPRFTTLDPHPKVQPSPLIGIIPGVGNKRSNRAWPITHYQQLIAQLKARYPATHVALIGGPDEAALAQQLMAELSEFEGIEDHCGKLSLEETAALLRQCTLVVAGDTGPLHMAAAVGTPIVQIFGPTSLKRTGAVGPQPIQSLTPPETLTCWPCEKPLCPYTGENHLACMNQIEPTRVLQAIETLLPSK